MRRRIFRRAGTHRNIFSPAFSPYNHGFTFRGSARRFDSAFAGFRHTAYVPALSYSVIVLQVKVHPVKKNPPMLITATNTNLLISLLSFFAAAPAE